MARALMVAALVVAGLAPAASGSDADAILGEWLTAESKEGRGRVLISKDGDRYYGKIVWLEIPVYPPDDEKGMAGQPKVDRENPDPTLRQRPTLGLEVVGGFVYAGDNLWKNGTIYDPEIGKTYKCKMTLTEDGTLKVRGFIGFSLIGRNTVWIRPPAPEPVAVQQPASAE